MRLFVAIELGEEFSRRLVEMQDALRAVAMGVSFTKPENLHLTLKFIGEVEEQRVSALCDALKGVPQVGQFDLNLIGPDFLPERGPIRIIGASVDGGEKLLSLQSAIEEACASQQIPRENRGYRPHITLARARRPLRRSAQNRLLEAIPESTSGSMPVDEFVLMLSQLTDKGSQYSVLYKIAT